MKLSLVVRYVFLFIILVLVQVLILNRVYFGGYINPYVYLIFILLLPIDVKGYVLLFSAFLIGLSVDVFQDTPGMHASSSLLMAFFRPLLIRLISVKSDFAPGTIPAIHSQGARWIMTYSFLLILLHHTALFFLEIFRFAEFFQTLYRAVISTLFSFVFVLIGFYLIGKTSDARS